MADKKKAKRRVGVVQPPAAVTGQAVFYPFIPGLDALLPPLEREEAGFVYYQDKGLNLVVCGPPGVGKTILALQMAVAAAAQGRTVIYLTKDTAPDVLAERVSETFGFFGLLSPSASGAVRHAPWCWEWPLTVTAPAVPGVVTKLSNLALVCLDGLADEIRKESDDAMRRGPAGAIDDEPPPEQWALKLPLLGAVPGRREGNWTGVIAFARFSESATALACMDRYLLPGNVMDALGHFQPSLRPALEALQYRRFARSDQSDQTDTPTDKGLFVVCDSLTPGSLGEQLRLQHLTGAKVDASPRLLKPRQQAPNGAPQLPKSGEPVAPEFKPASTPAPLVLFVLESPYLPEGGIAFAPDVQMQMGLRDEAHGVRTRTLRIEKTRYQKSFGEETAFLVIGRSDASTATEVAYTIGPGGALQPTAVECPEPALFRHRALGIAVMPPVSHEAMRRRESKPGGPLDVHFGIQGLDELTEERTQAGGGCTLLVTQNRCGSTALSLHYLLAQIGGKASPASVGPRSVLLVSFSADIADIMHTIWRHPCLRQALWTGDDAAAAWHRILGELREQVNAAQQDSSRHRLYKFRLLHLSDKCPNGTQTPFLYVYVPGFAWVTPEEAMDRFAALLGMERHCTADGGCRSCLAIDRVVVDRVGRLSARWPLVQSQDVFISGVAALCVQQGVSLMLIDDTADTGDAGMTFHSRWAGIAQNIIRLRRIPFHGSEAMTIELVRAGGRLIIASRPREIIFHHGAGSYCDAMRVDDSFRGYTGVFSGEPKRRTLKVDLSYDQVRTPLYREVRAAKENLESTVDGIQVRTISTLDWMGVNSAFSNLSSVARDTCHVVAIDEFWLKSLLEGGTLHRLTDTELWRALPVKVRDAIKPGGGDLPPAGDDELDKLILPHYVTRALTTAAARILHSPDVTRNRPIGGLGHGFHYAVPMRHNWGVLAVARPSRQYMRQMLDLVLPPPGGTVKVGERPTSRALRRLPSYLTKAAMERCRKAAVSAAKASGTDAAGAPEEVARTVLELLTGAAHTGGGDKGGGAPSSIRMGCPKPVRERLWATDRAPADGLSWCDLAAFRTDWWMPFWECGWFENALTALAHPATGSPNPWLVLCPRIDLFGLADTTEESIVSFLLELLLAEIAWGRLFVDVPQATTARLVHFRESAFDEEVPRVLVLFYRLLSPRQRRLLGIGVRTAHREIGYLRQSLLQDGGPAKNEFADWPDEICLFSRQWITTIDDLLPRYDLRESIEMTPLPTGAAERSFWGKICRGIPKERRGAAMDLAKAMGPTVAGTWYLGVLRGGNSDLGSDVLRELLTTEHERSRFLNRCGGPVTTDLYAEAARASSGGGGGRDGKPGDGPAQSASAGGILPYADIIAQLYPAQGEAGKEAVVFPFHRTQIVNYNEASVILYDLVRHVVRLQVDDEVRTLASANWGRGAMPPQNPKANALWRQVVSVSQRAAARLRNVEALK